MKKLKIKATKFPSVYLDFQLELNDKLYTNYKFPENYVEKEFLKKNYFEKNNYIERLNSFCKLNDININEISKHLKNDGDIIGFWQGIESKYNINDILFFLDNSKKSNFRQYMDSIIPEEVCNGYIPSPETYSNIIKPKLIELGYL